MTREVLTVKEASTALGLSRGSIEKLYKAGILPSVKAGRRILIPRTALSNFLANK